LASETTEVLFARYGPRYRWLATITVMLGTVAAMLTTTTVNVAIPDIMGAFGIGQDRAQWFSTGALAAMTVAMLLNAWLIRSFGQRKTLVGALCIFIVAMVLAGLSPNETMLTFCRVAQGAIAGLMQPFSVYTLFRVFPPDQRGSAMGLFGISVILGPALGPTMGGILIEHFNWRYIFFLGVPFSALAIVLASLFMPEREESDPRASFDWIGFLLLAASLACLLIGLSNGQREGWHSDYIMILLGLAVVGAFAFLAWELRASQPLVDLRVLVNARFAAAAAVAFIFGAGLFGSIYLIPLFVQTVQGFTPLASGLLLMPGGLVLGLIMPIGGFLSDRLSARMLIISGLLFAGVSAYWLASVDANTPFWTVARCVIFFYTGLGLSKPALIVAALRPLRPDQLGHGAGMINFSRQLGGAFGVNILSVVLDRRTFFHGSALANLQTAGNSGTAEFLRRMQDLLMQAGVPPDLQLSGALHFLDRVVYAQAYTLGFRDSFLVVAIVFTLALLPAWIMGKSRAGQNA
jgi:MFS transporter, DHA2 family, multidrug resistance protein